MDDELDITILEAFGLIILGFVAGIINTLAGGGSNLTIPALMVVGMPADVANATNRVGVLLQAIVGAKSFKKYDKLPTQDFKSIIIPMLIGSVVGSSLASFAPPSLLKYLLLGAMLTVAFVVLVRPSVIAPPPETIPFTVEQKPQALWWLLIIGFYGGFVQAGVGFIIITTFAGVLRYDLLSSNALKVLCTVFFTGISLAIFVVNDQVRWIPGLILAIGTMAGAVIGVKLAMNIDPKFMKWFLFIMTLAASAAAIFL